MMSQTLVTLTPFEEIFQRHDLADEPLTIQTEYRFEGRLDADRLRQAAREAIRLHPMARARLASARRFLRPPVWQIGESESRDVVGSISYETDAELDAARSAFYSRQIDMHEAPAVRFLLARGPAGDSLLFAVNHTITDGIGSSRFLHSVARAYSGRPDPVPDFDPVCARDLRAAHLSRPPSAQAPKAARPSIPKGRPSFIAPEGGAGEAGYGFCLLSLADGDRRALTPKRYGPTATNNDLLMAALHLTIDAWNTARGRPCEAISVLMPVNLRPLERYNEIVANQTLGGRVMTSRDQRRSDDAVMAGVMNWTQWLKSGGGLTKLLEIPGWLYRQLPVVLWAVSELMGDLRNTAVLTYFGRIDEKFLANFGPEAGRVEAIWGSPPVAMPSGLGIGAGVYHGRLLVTMRYRKALFDQAAAQRFAQLFLENLSRLGRHGSPGPTDERATSPVSAD